MDDSKVKTLLKLKAECRLIAIRIAPSFSTMFPDGVNGMVSLDVADEDLAGLTTEAKLDIKISLARSKLDELQKLEADLHRQTSPIPAASAAAANNIAANPRAKPESATRKPSCPPLPTNLLRVRTSRGTEASERTVPEDYWKFCFERLLDLKTAVGHSRLSAMYEEHCKAESKPCAGHQHWFKNHPECLFILFGAAQVRILQGTALHTSLKQHWARHGEQILQLLGQWLGTELTRGLDEDRVLATAVDFVRQSFQQWPTHGDELDTDCFEHSVVNRKRLLEEWSKTKASAGYTPNFDSELEAIQRKCGIKQVRFKKRACSTVVSGNLRAGQGKEASNEGEDGATDGSGTGDDLAEKRPDDRAGIRRRGAPPQNVMGPDSGRSDALFQESSPRSVRHCSAGVAGSAVTVSALTRAVSRSASCRKWISVSKARVRASTRA